MFIMWSYLEGIAGAFVFVFLVFAIACADNPKMHLHRLKITTDEIGIRIKWAPKPEEEKGTGGRGFFFKV